MDGRRVVDVEVVVQAPALDVVGRATDLLRGALVRVDDAAAVRVEEEHCVARRVEQPLEPDALAEQARVLDGRGGPAGEVLGERHVGRLEAPAGLAADERQDANDPA